MEVKKMKIKELGFIGLQRLSSYLKNKGAIDTLQQVESFLKKGLYQSKKFKIPFSGNVTFLDQKDSPESKMSVKFYVTVIMKRTKIIDCSIIITRGDPFRRYNITDIINTPGEDYRYENLLKDPLETFGFLIDTTIVPFSKETIDKESFKLI
jgi:hypothetical protein